MKKAARTVVAALLGLGAATASAQDVPVQNLLLRNSFSPFGAGARGLGMGGAFIAVADDGTATSFNPAGLAQLRSSELAVVGFASELTSNIRVPQLDGSVRVRPPAVFDHRALDFVGLAVPFDLRGRNLTLQLSYQRAVDLTGQGHTDSLGFERADDLFAETELRALGLPPDRSVAVVSELDPEQSGALHTASLAVGYQCTSRLALGVALNYWIGEWSAEGSASGALLLTPARPGQEPTELAGFRQVFFQDQSLRGLNVSAGFLIGLPRLSLGGVVRFPFRGDYKLDDFGQRSELFRGQVIDEYPTGAPMTSRLDWPRSAGVGLALRPFHGLTLAGELSSFTWSRMVLYRVPDGALLTPVRVDENYEPLPAEFTDRNLFDLFPAVQTTTRDTWQWRAGAEYLLSLPRLVIPLRGGLFRDRSPVVLDFERGRRIEGWTAGTGLNFSTIVLDVAFERRRTDGLIGYRLRPSREGGEVEFGFSPVENVKVDRVVVSLIWRPKRDADPLRNAFHWLFGGGRGPEEGKP